MVRDYKPRTMLLRLARGFFLPALTRYGVQVRLRVGLGPGQSCISTCLEGAALQGHPFRISRAPAHGPTEPGIHSARAPVPQGALGTTLGLPRISLLSQIF